MMEIPTEKLRIIDTENAVEEILAFARDLDAREIKPAFEVRYPPPETYTAEQREEWHQNQEDTFDAVYVEVRTGEIHTLPPYSELS